jgi:uncharacterized protein (DUF1800 family)
MYQKFLALATVFSLLAPVEAAPKKAENPAAAFQKKLSKDDQLRHALDRLTFGGRPGDFAQIKKVGLKKWIDLQLHPERIKENPELAARLKPLDSLTMPTSEVARRYPPPQLIRAVANGRQALPEDPVLRAAVERMTRRLKAQNGNTPATDQMEPVMKLEDVLPWEQIRTLRQGTPDERRALLSSLPDEKIDDLAVAAPPALRNQLMAIAPVDVRRKLMLMNAPIQVVTFDLMEAKLSRAILSNRQLEELLVDFWYNHFNVFLDKGADRLMVPTYEREAIRPHVLGKFRELLGATAHSSAMMFYLDNWQSVAPPLVRRPNGNRPQRGLNENYARELLELHTLGVDGGYTQQDIIEVARCFTGWTIEQPQRSGEFWYNDRVHDKGEKTVLGVKIPAGGGKEDGEKVLDIIAAHPSTAKFVSRKLAVRFVADNPPQALIDRMAKTFTATTGDIRAVLKTMLDSKEFWSQGAFHAKIKTPLEMVVSSVRAVGAQLDSAFALANQIQQLGQPLYRKQEPTGYSAMNAEWVNSASLLGRMNFALQLAQNRVPGVKVDGGKFPADPAAAAKQLLQRDPSRETLAAIEKAMKEQQERNPRQQTTPGVIAGLVVGSPDFQRR